MKLKLEKEKTTNSNQQTIYIKLNHDFIH